jgi:hypothetical protein
LVVETFGVEFNTPSIDVQEPKRRLTGVFRKGCNLGSVWSCGTDSKLASATESRIAKTVEGCVLALVVVVLLACLLEYQLDFSVGQRGSHIFEVVFNQLIFPGTWVRPLEIDPNVE